MQKPIVFNRFLNKKWKAKENSFLEHKITLVRAEIDVRCPNSYMNFKTKLKRENPKMSESIYKL